MWIKTFIVDGPWDGDFTCGTVPGVLATVDFGNTTNTTNIDFYFKQQNKYSNGGKLYILYG